MYERLTKTVVVDGRECVTCKFSGTEQCRIHNGVTDCGHCPVFGAILNQLYAFENLMCEAEKEDPFGESNP